MIASNSRNKENGLSRLFPIPIIMCSILIILLASSNVKSQGAVAYDGPGFAAQYPDESMLYLKGVEENLFIDRNWTTITGLPAGSSTFSKTNPASMPTVYLAQASPVQEPVLIQGNVTISLFASLETSSSVCSSTNLIPGTSLGADTQFLVSVRISGNAIFSDLETNSIAMTND